MKPTFDGEPVDLPVRGPEQKGLWWYSKAERLQPEPACSDPAAVLWPKDSEPTFEAGRREPCFKPAGSVSWFALKLVEVQQNRAKPRMLWENTNDWWVLGSSGSIYSLGGEVSEPTEQQCLDSV